MLRNAGDFAAHGGKLLKLDFSDVHVQRFSNVAVIYSHYSLAAEQSGRQFSQAGRCMEVFVLNDGKWTNPGWQIDATRPQDKLELDRTLSSAKWQ
jgi:Domain of unknown function (DUF4440)